MIQNPNQSIIKVLTSQDHQKAACSGDRGRERDWKRVRNAHRSIIRSCTVSRTGRPGVAGLRRSSAACNASKGRNAVTSSEGRTCRGVTIVGGFHGACRALGTCKQWSYYGQITHKGNLPHPLHMLHLYPGGILYRGLCAYGRADTYTEHFGNADTSRYRQRRMQHT